MAAARDTIAVLGEVVGSYGVRGWLKVRPFSEQPDALLGYATWWLKRARGDWREFRQLGGRMHSGAVLAALRGVETREAALALKGSEVGVPRVAPPAPAGEIYWDDLTGLAVVNRAGVLLGEVSRADRARGASAAAGHAPAGGAGSRAADPVCAGDRRSCRRGCRQDRGRLGRRLLAASRVQGTHADRRRHAVSGMVDHAAGFGVTGPRARARTVAPRASVEPAGLRRRTVTGRSTIAPMAAGRGW